jgi:prevent-host-death family protein
MRYSTKVKPISYLKAHAAEVLLDLGETREPMIITQNGEAKAVIMDVASFEQTQEMLALLKLLAIGDRDVEEGKSRRANAVIERLRSKPTTG